MSQDTFSPELRKAIVEREHIHPDYVESLVHQYRMHMARVPGAPLCSQLTPADIRAIREIPAFIPQSYLNWEVFSARMRERERSEHQAQNPYLPRWLGKTDENKTVWTSDTGTMDAGQQTQLTVLIEKSCPPLAKTLRELMGLPPVDNVESLMPVIEAMTRFMPMFLMPLGDHDSDKNDFRWSRTLAFLGGLSLPIVQHLAKHVQDNSQEAEFQHYATCTEKQLMDETLKAWETSGYGMGLIRTDFVDVTNILETCDLARAPQWYMPLALLHVLKHVRYYPKIGEGPALVAAYRGRNTVIPLTLEGSLMSLVSTTNQAALRSLCSVLRISPGAGKKKTPCEIAVAGALNFIYPRQLPEPIDLRSRVDLIAPLGVRFRMAIEKHSEHKWIDPGVEVISIAQTDLSTGLVNKDAVIRGPDALALKWSFEPTTMEEIISMKSNLPDKIEPALPSEILFKTIKNINSLGKLQGLKTLIDTFMLADLIRDKVLGSPVGNALMREYPLIFLLPMDATPESTTNQGKTNTGRILAGALAPGLRETQCGGTTSAPAQRAISYPIERYGTALFDEFQIPQSPDHFLNHAGLQMLSTGGTVTPGRAMENSQGCRLSHPLFIAAKFGTDMADVLNRQIAIFLDVLTAESKCSKEDLSRIMSGLASMEIRLAALRWIEATGFVEKVNAAVLVHGNWRFNAHLAIAGILGDPNEVEDYLAASVENCIRQRNDAIANDLPSKLGLKSGFDPLFYFDQADEGTLTQLEATCRSKGPMRLLPALTDLVEDMGRRKFKPELDRFYIQERGAIIKFAQLLGKHPFKRPGWILRLIPSTESGVKGDGRTNVSVVTFEKDEATAVKPTVKDPLDPLQAKK